MQRRLGPGGNRIEAERLDGRALRGDPRGQAGFEQARDAGILRLRGQGGGGVGGGDQLRVPGVDLAESVRPVLRRRPGDRGVDGPVGDAIAARVQQVPQFPRLAVGQAGPDVCVDPPQQLTRGEADDLLERVRVDRPGGVGRREPEAVEEHREPLLDQLAAHLDGRDLLERGGLPEPVLDGVRRLLLDAAPRLREAGDDGQGPARGLAQRHQAAGDLFEQERRLPVRLAPGVLVGRLHGLGDHQVDLVHRDHRRTDDGEQPGDVPDHLLGGPSVAPQPPPGPLAGLLLVHRGQEVVADVLHRGLLGRVEHQGPRGVLALRADLPVLLADQVGERVERRTAEFGLAGDRAPYRPGCPHLVGQPAQERP